jgi:hypothetical protein
MGQGLCTQENKRTILYEEQEDPEKHYSPHASQLDVARSNAYLPSFARQSRSSFGDVRPCECV